MDKRTGQRLLATPQGRVVYAAIYGATLLTCMELFAAAVEMGGEWVKHRRGELEAGTTRRPQLRDDFSVLGLDGHSVIVNGCFLHAPGADPLDLDGLCPRHPSDHGDDDG